MSPVRVDVHLDDDYLAAALRADVREGLTATPKFLSPKWFYDAVGSELFEVITGLPEYYPTRAEREVLVAHAADIARTAGAHTVVELGSGSSEKTRLLLDALSAHGTLRRFVPLDVSESALRDATRRIADDYRNLLVHGVVGDFTEHLDRLPGETPRLVAFLGGTIGNFLPPERAKLLASIRDVCGSGGWLLLGNDLVKDPATLIAAYDDAAGVTARFNRNVLRVLNRELGADFDVDAFEHVAVWDDENAWIEMRLRATRAMTVRIPVVDMDIRLSEGEQVRTEISAKFRLDQIVSELTDSGFDARHSWTDDLGRYAVTLAQVCD
ncbi:L-histidine N(alpha)-methyltransferase [Nocardia terpenica]|uniref:Histidine N-alpha-methyltransferase n=1 Tax=Nocardia terpenica TaxID=455432 RepID=A0A6G9ZAC0_9NOCA|nr:L-histidine N(alpha)-methyltransferase [Nocardia terpenica]QIS22488.1 L-histidine N(alpha)-methyltransferase [Nocardia terpenica]